MVYAILLAGGVGSRMTGYDVPKQFIMINNVPIIIHTIRKFINCTNIDKIIVCCINSHKEELNDLIKTHLNENLKDIYVTEGGKNRSESILKGCFFIDENYLINDDDIVLTHDGVRPFLNSRIINENIDTLNNDKECFGVNTVVPAIDTIVVSQDGKCVHDIPNRNEMYLTQTPQTFRVKELMRAYDNLNEKELEYVTDACQVVLKQNKKISLVHGEYYNIKITTNDDVEHARIIANWLK